jgi:hypothetical protein
MAYAAAQGLNAAAAYRHPSSAVGIANNLFTVDLSLLRIATEQARRQRATRTHLRWLKCFDDGSLLQRAAFDVGRGSKPAS